MTTKQLRGFALLSPERRKEIACKGGKAAHKAGTAHCWNSEEAKVAGRKGGLKGKGLVKTHKRKAKPNQPSRQWSKRNAN